MRDSARAAEWLLPVGTTAISNTTDRAPAPGERQAGAELDSADPRRSLG
jgi:hypothetical protein